MGIFRTKKKSNEELIQIFESGEGYDVLSKSELVRLTGMYVDAKTSLEAEITKLRETGQGNIREINGLNRELKDLNTKYTVLLRKYDSSTADLQTLTESIGGLQVQLSGQKEKYNSSTADLQALTESIGGLQVQLSEQKEKYQTLDDKFINLTEENAELEGTIEKLKKPFKFEDLQALIGQHVNTEYQKIKEYLVKSFLELGAEMLYETKSNRSEIINETIELLASNGVQKYYNDGQADGVSLRIKFGENNYLLGKDRINSMRVHFDDSIIYDNELKGHQYSAKKFKSSSNIDKQDIFNVDFSLNCPENNIFREMILNDSALFVKAALMGEARKLIENKNYSTAMNLIKNNGLREFALPYINNNMDNKEMLSYFANLVNQDK